MKQLLYIISKMGSSNFVLHYIDKRSKGPPPPPPTVLLLLLLLLLLNIHTDSNIYILIYKFLYLYIHIYVCVCMCVHICMCVWIYIYIYIYKGQSVRWILPQELVIGGSVFSYTFFKEINSDGPFMSQKTVSMTFFTDCCYWNFSLAESQCVFTS